MPSPSMTFGQRRLMIWAIMLACVMQMIDNGDSDDKIIAVAANDPSVNHYNNIEELPKHFFDELRHFFEEYKKLENKTVIVEEFGDKSQALKVIEDAMAYYKKNFKR